MPTVLYLAHGFPPASGSGPVRALAFARYLVAFGWRPIVLTPGAAWAMHADARLLAQVPAWLEVVRTRSLEPRLGPPAPATTQRVMTARHLSVTGDAAERHTRRHTVEKRSRCAASDLVERHTGRHTSDGGADGPHGRVGWRVGHAGGLGRWLWAGDSSGGPGRWLWGGDSGGLGLWGGDSSGGLGRWLRRHVGHLRRFPDAHLGWLPFAVAAGLRLAPRVDVLYSSSGPFTSHLVGLVLHRLTGRPWVAELRDGWYLWNRAIFPDYPGWRGVLEARLESAVVYQATRLVCVTERMASVFRHQYPDLPAEHFTVVPNGFDPASVQAEVREDTQPAGFQVLHAGALYYGRPIGPFLEAAARLVDEDAEFARAFSLELVGSLDQTALAEVAGSRIAARVTCRGQLDHPSTLARERAADLLLLVANTTPGAEATVPGKLFEYLASGRPVLAIAPQESATADVLARTGGGWLAEVSDPEAIYRQLRAAFRWLRLPDAAGPGRPGACAVDPSQLARFDRRRLAGELARVLDAAVLA